MFQRGNLQRWVISLLILMVGLGFAWPHLTSAATFANRSSVSGSQASSHVGQIAFGSTRDGNWEIYLMNADGTGQINLTNNPAQDSSAAWSPDGNQIAFDSMRDGNWEIYMMNPDGSAQTRLTNNSAVDVAMARMWVWRQTVKTLTPWAWPQMADLSSVPVATSAWRVFRPKTKS